MTANYTIRTVQKTDVTDILAIYRPHVLQGAVSFETQVPTIKQMWVRIEKNSIDNPWLVAVQGGKVLGYAYANAHRWRAAYRWAREVSVYVLPNAHSRGIGSALYHQLFDLLRIQGFCTALAGIVLPNAASIALHRKLGFEPVATYRNIGYKHGIWYDTVWWQLQLQLPADVEEPIPFSELDASIVQASLINEKG